MDVTNGVILGPHVLTFPSMVDLWSLVCDDNLTVLSVRLITIIYFLSSVIAMSQCHFLNWFLKWECGRRKEEEKKKLFLSQPEAEPEIEHLYVADITPESFRIAWTVVDGIFDRFVIRVRDAKKLAHPHEFNVAGDERTKVMTNLMGDTEYEIELYGVTLEHRSEPLTTGVRTGTVGMLCVLMEGAG